MARTRYVIQEPDKPHFLTCTIVEWLPVFTRPDAVQILLDSWSHQRVNNGFRLFGYVILENHLHFVARGPPIRQVRKQLQALCGCPAYRAAGGAQGRAAVGSPAIRETGAQARPGTPVPAGRRPCGDDLQRACDAGKAGLYPPEPGEAGIRGHPRALAVFECAELPRRAGADRG